MQARWHNPTGAWQRFTVVESEHAINQEGLGDGIGVALLAHTGCYLEVVVEEEEEGEDNDNDNKVAMLQAKVQRQTEYAPRPPTPAQTFVIVPMPLPTSDSNATVSNEVCLQSLDGKWRLAAAYGKEPRPGVGLLQRVGSDNNNNLDEKGKASPACRWTVESPAAGLAPLRCGYVLPLHNYNDDDNYLKGTPSTDARGHSSSVKTSGGSSSSGSGDGSGSSGGSSSEMVWFGCGPHESYLDRKAGARVGKWRGPVAEQTFR